MIVFLEGSNQMNSAANILADYLAKSGMSQRQLAKLTGITQASISRVLAKEFFMSVKMAKVIEKHTGLSARVLLIADIDYKLGELG